MLGVVTNPHFRPTDILYRTVQTMENNILKACFPEGYKTMDLTRKKDGDQKVSPPQDMYDTCTVNVLLCTVCTGEAEQACTGFKIHIILYNSFLKIHKKYITIHDGTRPYTPSAAGVITPAAENMYFAYFQRVRLCTFIVLSCTVQIIHAFITWYGRHVLSCSINLVQIEHGKT
jgi:hypothetical protein